MFTFAVAGPFPEPSRGTRKRSAGPRSDEPPAATAPLDDPSSFFRPREVIVPSAYAPPATTATSSRPVPLFMGDSYRSIAKNTCRAKEGARTASAAFAVHAVTGARTPLDAGRSVRGVHEARRQDGREARVPRVALGGDDGRGRDERQRLGIEERQDGRTRRHPAAGRRPDASVARRCGHGLPDLLAVGGARDAVRSVVRRAVAFAHERGQHERDDLVAAVD